MKQLITLFAVLGLVLALAPTAQAANVTWQTPTSVYASGDATVLTDGDLITTVAGHLSAESYGDGVGTGDYTVNGVTFKGVLKRANFNGDSSGGMGQSWQYIDWGDDLTPAFSNLLNGTSSGPAATTITLDGLTPTKSYIAQFFIGDQREATNDGNPNGRYLDGNYKITGGANTSSAVWIMPIHSFVGSWVADAETQAFTITNTDGVKTLSALLNAAQWREVTGGSPPAR